MQLACSNVLSKEWRRSCRSSATRTSLGRFLRRLNPICSYIYKMLKGSLKPALLLGLTLSAVMTDGACLQCPYCCLSWLRVHTFMRQNLLATGSLQCSGPYLPRIKHFIWTQNEMVGSFTTKGPKMGSPKFVWKLPYLRADTNFSCVLAKNGQISWSFDFQLLTYGLPKGSRLETVRF